MKKRLGKSADATRRRRPAPVIEIVHEYVTINEWQIKEIKKALKEADRGEFASGHDVRKVLNRLTSLR